VTVRVKKYEGVMRSRSGIITVLAATETHVENPKDSPAHLRIAYQMQQMTLNDFLETPGARAVPDDTCWNYLQELAKARSRNDSAARERDDRHVFGTLTAQWTWRHPFSVFGFCMPSPRG